MRKQPFCQFRHIGFAVRVGIPIALSVFFFALPTFATQYWTPEQIQTNNAAQHASIYSQPPSINPPPPPPGIYPANYVNRYMLTANWLRALQVTTAGSDFGGQREGEGGVYNIIETDNTQEAIVVWSNARLLTGNDTLFQTELPRSWIYVRNFPAWLEGGNNNYYSSHNSCWGIAATMAYVTATHDSTVMGYGDSCANYIRDYPCIGSYSQDAEGMAIGALALYARWQVSPNDQVWLDTALARGQRLRAAVQASPAFVLGNAGAGWALSGGCVFWGILNSICRQDTVFGIPWVNTYSQYLGVNGGNALWANAWTTWYGNAWTNAYQFTHRQAYRDTSIAIAEYLIAQDADHDGGIPPTVGDASTQDQSWVSMYLNWMLLYPLINLTQPYEADLGVSVSILPNRYIVQGDSLWLQVSVSNFGRTPMSYSVHGKATGASLAFSQTWSDTALDISSSRTYTYSLGVANSDSVFAFTRFVTHDTVPGDNSAAVQVIVHPTIQVTGSILSTGSVGLSAVLTFRSLDDTTRSAQAVTNGSGAYTVSIPAGRWVVAVDPAIPAVRPVPDTIQFSAVSHQYDKILGNAYLWVLEDDSTTSYASYIVPSVASTGVSYRHDRIETVSDPEGALQMFPSVLWFTGDRVAMFDSAKRAAIRSALHAGTNFVMSGQNIAERLNTVDAALLHRFGTTLQGFHIINYHIIGIASTPWAGVDTYITGANGAGNQTSQDALGVYSGGFAVAYYNGFSSTYAAVATSQPDSAKTLLTGFGLEAIHGINAQSRAALMQRIVTWLQTSSAPEGAPAALPNRITLSTYPNPFNNELRVSIAVPHAGDVTIAIYNALGQQVETAKFYSHGMVNWNWNAARFGSGIYWVSVQSRDQSALKKVVYIR